ncbi:MAG: UvrD-helicase domain-containing protein [Bacteroidota bacterium]
MPGLTIYKASAGSGKTYKLTGEYLRLLFSDSNNYRRILGVTFTNKATGEMKSRIINELHLIAKGEYSSYCKTFTGELGITAGELQKRARKLINKLLHDYSRFSISTIDSFFSQLIQAFAREIGLFSGYSIELDKDTVLDEAIDNLVFNLKDHEALKNWLVNFILLRTESGKSWNIREEIRDLSLQIFNEKYQAFANELEIKISDHAFMNGYIRELKQISEGFEQHMSDIGKKALELISSHGLEISDFIYKEAGVAGYFRKISEKSEFIPGTRPLKAANNPDEWYTGKEKNEPIITLYNAGLNKLLCDALEYYNNNSVAYYTALIISRHIHSLGLITDISSRVRAVTKEKNIFLLSDAAAILQAIIDGNDAPFIYEKTGSFYRHFMIDEFQDTSGMQWNNFRPLIINSLSEGNKSLVVGDIKQSIYRWRNGDWKLLGARLEQDFQVQGTEIIPLDFNYRSKKNIVLYNNTVFTNAADILQQKLAGDSAVKDDYGFAQWIGKAYDTVLQKLPGERENDGGMIRNIFLKDKSDQSSQVFSYLPGIIEDLQEKGIDARDICILTRRNTEGTLIAGFLLEYQKSGQAKAGINYRFISGEALYVSSSAAVRFIADVLRYLLDPDNQLVKSRIAYWYSSNFPTGHRKEFHRVFLSCTGSDDMFRELLPEAFTSCVEQVKKLPLYELCERIISIFGLSDRHAETAYLTGFQDIIHRFTCDKSTGIAEFLEWWDDAGVRKTLSLPEEADAMRILTIHKSKGLEFRAVIIPFCNWDIDDSRHRPVIWCKPSCEPFNQLEIVPVDYSKNMTQTIFNRDYLEEKTLNYIDNLNMLYVAFTRAREALVTISPLPEKDDIKTAGDLLFRSVKKPANVSWY